MVAELDDDQAALIAALSRPRAARSPRRLGGNPHATGCRCQSVRRFRCSATLKDVEVPAGLAGGWLDIFPRGQLRDFTSLQDAGRLPRLTIGPWSRDSPAVTMTTVHARPSVSGSPMHAALCPPNGLRSASVIGADKWRGRRLTRLRWWAVRDCCRSREAVASARARRTRMSSSGCATSTPTVVRPTSATA